MTLSKFSSYTRSDALPMRDCPGDDRVPALTPAGLSEHSSENVVTRRRTGCPCRPCGLPYFEECGVSNTTQIAVCLDITMAHDIVRYFVNLSIFSSVAGRNAKGCGYLVPVMLPSRCQIAEDVEN